MAAPKPTLLEAKSISVDKLSFTLAVKNESDQDALDALLKKYASDTASIKTYANANYFYNLRFKEDKFDFGNLLIQWKPKATDRNYIRIEFNPGNIVGLKKFQNTLRELLGDSLYESLYNDMKITKIHFAIDYCILNILRFFVDTTRYGASKVFNTIGVKSINGDLGSIYLGNETAKNSLIIYNKTEEQRKKSRLGKAKRAEWGFDDCPDGHTLVRFEVKYNPNIKIEEFLEYMTDNVFCYITVYSVPEIDKDDFVFNFFISHCIVHGLRPAFQYLKKSCPDEALRIKNIIYDSRCKLDLLNMRQGIRKAMKQLLYDLSLKPAKKVDS